ncbi:hypothetical protein [uncultured Pseudokineococcus sp.]|uniref:hypothetical protein n=1 Tax=uncultured Pseudokineococcus sp. TaxID=1642928 RepID=UPI00262CD8A5|nr:hypothetical protein [uncultured Pseudokineococcus sp.]
MILGAPVLATGLVAVGAVLAATPAPGAPVQAPEPTSVGPGTEGFIWTFLVVIAVVLLMLNMVARLRRMERRRVQDERAEDERRRATGPRGPGGDEGAGGGGAP